MYMSLTAIKLVDTWNFACDFTLPCSSWLSAQEIASTMSWWMAIEDLTTSRMSTIGFVRKGHLSPWDCFLKEIVQRVYIRNANTNWRTIHNVFNCMYCLWRQVFSCIAFSGHKKYKNTKYKTEPCKEDEKVFFFTVFQPALVIIVVCLFLFWY